MERNLPSTQDEAPPVAVAEEPVEVAPRPVSVAFLPLGLVTFLVLAFTIAAWTLLHTAF